MDSADNIKRIMKQFIIESYLTASGLDHFEDDDSLMEKGIVDSTGVLELLEFIEEKFQIVIEDEEVIPAKLDSLNNLTSFIESKLKHVGQ